jgi:hypothetical protein
VRSTEALRLGADQLEAEDVPLPVTIPPFNISAFSNDGVDSEPPHSSSVSDREYKRLLSDISDFLHLTKVPSTKGLEGIALFHHASSPCDTRYLSSLSHSQVLEHYHHHLDSLVSDHHLGKAPSEDGLYHLAHLAHALAVWPELPKVFQHTNIGCPLHRANIIQAAQDEVDLQVASFPFMPSSSARVSSSSSSGSTETLTSGSASIATQAFDFSHLKSTLSFDWRFRKAKVQFIERSPGVIGGHLKKKQTLDQVDFVRDSDLDSLLPLKILLHCDSLAYFKLTGEAQTSPALDW